MLAAALWRHRRDGALEDLEQRLLHALARHVPGDARILRLARDLVDLVDVDDAPLALRDVELAGLEQPHQDVLHVLAPVAGLGERGASAMVKGRRGCGPGSARAASCRRRSGRSAGCSTCQLDVGVPAVRGVDPLVVVVDGDGQGPLCALLADHVLVQDFLDFTRRDLGDVVRYLALLTSARISLQTSCTHCRCRPRARR